MIGQHQLNATSSTPSSGRSSSMAQHQHGASSMEISPLCDSITALPITSNPAASEQSMQPNSYHYIDQHLSYHRQDRQQAGSQEVSLNLMLPTTIGRPPTNGTSATSRLLKARSPVSPLGLCDTQSNGISSTFSSASVSPSSPRILTTMGCHAANQISKLSLHCNNSNSSPITLAGVHSAQGNLLQRTGADMTQTNHLVCGQGKRDLSLGGTILPTSLASEGSFGLLADVAVAAAAAEEQTRIEQQSVSAAAAAHSQPIDLSKK